MVTCVCRHKTYASNLQGQHHRCFRCKPLLQVDTINTCIVVPLPKPLVTVVSKVHPHNISLKYWIVIQLNKANEPYCVKPWNCSFPWYTHTTTKTLFISPSKNLYSYSVRSGCCYTSGSTFQYVNS